MASKRKRTRGEWDAPFLSRNASPMPINARSDMGTKLLVVDDSELVRATVVLAFRGFECQILEAQDGIQGLAMATREQPDVILLDLSMPIMDGIEILQRLNSNPVLRGIPLIMLTSDASRETVLRIARLGVRDYLLKPFHEKHMVE